MKTIEILVRLNGETRVETRGFAGDECREASRLLESTLGKRQSEVLTSEFYAKSQIEQNRQQER
ncbi:DUF2997 domain-containing protein [Stieleria sp. JC731]|uniref:DUF2997 domain-containing protein n=1 Tax=Pirellulaceae TaxID=2691357 RepID=UPI001E573AF8|nr:DUF2997 domain-containing protein [Stieleria sp. JC731]MCC9601042.1 DUF2997 domain-containing protein [Stieleria sp. JC731]